MKTAEWRRLVRPLLPLDRSWGEARHAFYELPVRWLAVGIIGETSRWNTSMRVHRLASPLVPAFPALVLDLGPPASPTSLNFYDPPELESAVAELLDDVPTEAEAMEYIATSVPAQDEKAETVGYMRYLIGDRSGAEKALVAAQDPGLSRDWELQRVERVGGMLELLRFGDDDRFIYQLDRWAEETASASKISRTPAVPSIS